MTKGCISITRVQRAWPSSWQWHCYRAVSRPPRRGSRTVATGGAKRNPWTHRASHCPGRGRGGSEPGAGIMLPLPRRGKRRMHSFPRVALRSTRGYSPWPSGPKKTSDAKNDGYTRFRRGGFQAWNASSECHLPRIDVPTGATQGWGAKFLKNDAPWGADGSAVGRVVVGSLVS